MFNYEEFKDKIKNKCCVCGGEFNNSWKDYKLRGNMCINCYRAKFSKRYYTKGKSKLTDLEKETALKLHQKGFSCVYISKVLLVKYHHINRFIRKATR